MTPPAFEPTPVPAFFAFQLVGAVLAIGLVRALYADITDVVVPQVEDFRC